MRKLVTIKKYVVGIAMIMLLGGLCMSFGQKFDPAMLPFQAKEKLIYKIYYNLNFVWIPAGEVVFEVKDEGDLYHLEVTGRTYPSYEWFYKVRDNITPISTRKHSCQNFTSAMSIREDIDTMKKLFLITRIM